MLSLVDCYKFKDIFCQLPQDGKKVPMNKKENVYKASAHTNLIYSMKC